jgi:hypothetical protein
VADDVVGRGTDGGMPLDGPLQLPENGGSILFMKLCSEHGGSEHGWRLRAWMEAQSMDAQSMEAQSKH